MPQRLIPDCRSGGCGFESRHPRSKTLQDKGLRHRKSLPCSLVVTSVTPVKVSGLALLPVLVLGGYRLEPLTSHPSLAVPEQFLDKDSESFSSLDCQARETVFLYQASAHLLS